MQKKICLLGDSMIDTYDFMGQGFPELQKELQLVQSDALIELKNHGVGSTSIELAFKRISDPYEYVARGRSLPAILEEKPDIVVVESCAYNHWSNSETDLQKYIEYHQKIVDILKGITQVLLLSTISPHEQRFAQGVLSLGWDAEKTNQEYQLVIKYLRAFNVFAKNSGLPYVNGFEQSLNSSTGELKYISNVDYIHYSYEGREFISKLLAPEIHTLLQ